MANTAVYEEELDSGTPVSAGMDDAGDGAPAGGEGTPKGEERPAAAAPSKAEQREAAELRRRIAELEQSERYWADKAKAAPAPAAKDAADEDDGLDALLADAGGDEGTAAELLDEIGEKGVAALAKRGLMTKADVRQVVAKLEARLTKQAQAIAAQSVNGARDQLTAEAKLLQDYPDLGNAKSELAIEAGKEFAAMVAEDPSLKNNYAALRSAARMAQLKLGGGQGAGTVASRMERIASQAPTRGARASAASEFEDDDVATSAEAQQLIAAGAKYGLTQDVYRANQKGGRQ